MSRAAAAEVSSVPPSRPICTTLPSWNEGMINFSWFSSPFCCFTHVDTRLTGSKWCVHIECTAGLFILSVEFYSFLPSLSQNCNWRDHLWVLYSFVFLEKLFSEVKVWKPLQSLSFWWKTQKSSASVWRHHGVRKCGWWHSLIFDWQTRIFPAVYCWSCQTRFFTPHSTRQWFHLEIDQIDILASTHFERVDVALSAAQTVVLTVEKQSGRCERECRGKKSPVCHCQHETLDHAGHNSLNSRYNSSHDSGFDDRFESLFESFPKQVQW